MLFINSKHDPDWLTNTLDAVKYGGAAIVTDVLSPDLLERIRPAMYEAQARTLEEVGQDRLDRAGEVGVMRVMLSYDPVFAELLELPELLAVVDNTVSDTAVMHLQNGLILPPFSGNADAIHQFKFHMDFPRYMEGYMASVNTMLAIDEFTARNGGTLVVPGTHQRPGAPRRSSSRPGPSRSNAHQARCSYSTRRCGTPRAATRPTMTAWP